MGERVRECRRARGMTQEQLAERVNISTSFIGHIERGEKKASVETILSICTALDSSADYILRGRENNCDRQRCPFFEQLTALFHRFGGQ